MEEKQVHIPEGWKIRDFGKLITEKKKSPLKVSDAANFGEFPFFTSGEAVLQHTTKQLDGKNIFLATGGVANIKYYEGAASYSTDTYVVTGREEIETEYLYFDLLNILYYINANYFQGSGLKHLQKKDLKNHQIIFPVNPREQLKIVDILSKVDEAISQTEQLIAKYTRIKTGLMQDLLTKGIDEHGNIRSEETHEFKDSPLGRIPKEWEMSVVSNVCDDIFLGLTSKVDYVEVNGFPLIRATDVNNGTLSFNDVLSISEKQHKKLTKHRKAKRGDVLITKSGTLGICALVDTDREFSIYESIIVLQPKRQKLHSNFLLWLLRNKPTQDNLLGAKVGSTIGHLNIIQFRELIVAIPNIKEQIKISELITNSDKYLHELYIENSKLKSLKTGLMQDLLSGKVRVNHIIESVTTKEKMR